MLWTPTKKYIEEQFELEADLEEAIQEVKEDLFGASRIYLEVKKKIGQLGKTQNIPDAYLIDLTSKKTPVLFVIENELAKHHPLKHIAVQILQFSLSFEASPQAVKSILKNALLKENTAKVLCEKYAIENGFENVDVLLEKMIYREDAFKAMVIIDEVSDELETVLISRFKFPVEVISLERFVDDNGKRLYQFEPFLPEASPVSSGTVQNNAAYTLDPSEWDTVVVPAREEGFKEVFIGENCWHAIRMNSSMIPKVKYIAAYQVAPISAITHIARIHGIEQWKDTNKYKLIFEEPATKIGPIKLVSKGNVKAPQGHQYTSYERLRNAKTMDDAF